jgi:hypothetical protein
MREFLATKQKWLIPLLNAKGVAHPSPAATPWVNPPEVVRALKGEPSSLNSPTLKPSNQISTHKPRSEFEV